MGPSINNSMMELGRASKDDLIPAKIIRDFCSNVAMLQTQE